MGGGQGIQVNATATDAVISGVTVDGATGNNINIGNANNLLIQNVTLNNAGATNISANFSDNGNHTFTVDGVTTTNATGSSIAINVSNTTTLTALIKNSTSDNPTAHGIVTNVLDNSTVSATIDNNVVNNSGSVGINFRVDDNAFGSAVITNNQVDTVTSFNGILVRAQNSGTVTDFTIAGNHVQNAGAQGIRVDDCCIGGGTSAVLGGIIRNNIVESNVNRGIDITNSNNPGGFGEILVDGNTIRNNATQGLNIFSSNGAVSVKVQNNIITGNGGNGVGIDDDTASAFVVDLGGGSLGSTGGNQIFNNATDVFVDLDGGELKAEGNWWGVSTGLDGSNVTLNSGTIDADPFLTSAP